MLLNILKNEKSQIVNVLAKMLRTVQQHCATYIELHKEGAIL